MKGNYYQVIAFDRNSKPWIKGSFETAEQAARCTQKALETEAYKAVQIKVQAPSELAKVI